MRLQSLVLGFFAAAAAAAPQSSLPGREALRRRDVTDSVWCGPVLSGHNFTEVSATWTVPTSTPFPYQYSQDLYNYQWVGIDGASPDCHVILQAGTFARVKDGALTYGFWYEFYPDSSWLLYEPVVNPGDTVFVKITATSKTTGTAYMKNLSTGKDTWINLTAPPGYALCNTAVEWIQENASGQATGIAPFSSFKFDNCAASDAYGRNYNLRGAEHRNLVIDWQWYCHPSRVSGTSVQIDYTGPLPR